MYTPVQTLVLGDGMGDGMKNSPHNGPGTPRDDMPPASAAEMGAYPGLPYQDNVNPVSSHMIHGLGDG